MPPPGPYKMTGALKALYVARLAAGERRHASARALGVTPRAILHNRQRDPAFAEACMLAEIESDDPIEDSLRRAALDGNVQAALAWLRSRQPDRWPTVARLEHSGPDGGPVELSAASLLARISALRDEPDPGE